VTFEAVHACFGPPIITDFELATIWEREAHSTTISKKGAPTEADAPYKQKRPPGLAAGPRDLALTASPHTSCWRHPIPCRLSRSPLCS
jgi:hypothetical protein